MLAGKSTSAMQRVLSVDPSQRAHGVGRVPVDDAGGLWLCHGLVLEVLQTFLTCTSALVLVADPQEVRSRRRRDGGLHPRRTHTWLLPLSSAPSQGVIETGSSSK